MLVKIIDISLCPKLIIMKHKQFKIGEYAIGGIIDVTINGDEIEIKCLDWTTKEKVVGKTFDCGKLDSDFSILETLNEYTSSYYSDEIFDWIKQYVTFNQEW